MGVTKTNQLFQYVTGTGWKSVSVPFTPSGAENAIAATGDMVIAALDTSGGIHVSTDEGNTWSTIEGTASSISGGGWAMFVRNSSGVSYHVNLVVPAVTNTGGGFWACPPAEGCPPGSYHTQTATAHFGGVGGAHGTAGVTTKASGYPENVLAPVATETGTNCDPFFGDPDQTAACFAYYDGNSSCSVMGPLNSLTSTGIGYQLEGAQTLIKLAGAPLDCEQSVLTKLTYCDMPVENWCTPQTTPPDLDFNGVNIHDVLFQPPTQFWTVYGGCVRFVVDGINGPWECRWLPPTTTSILPNIPLGNCTSNP
jgi:hypothetical protein